MLDSSWAKFTRAVSGVGVMCVLFFSCRDLFLFFFFFERRLLPTVILILG